MAIVFSNVDNFIIICCAFTCLVLIISWLVVFITLVYACVVKMLINYTPVWGCTKIPGGECHRHRNRVKKKTMRFEAFVVIGDSDVDACRYADEPWQFQCTCTMVFQLEIGADDHDIMIWCHKGLSCCKREGTIKGEHDQTLGLLLLSSGYSGTKRLH